MKTKLILAILGPPIAAGSAWLVGAVGKYGIHLDKSGINALMVAGATGAIALVVKLIHDVEKKNPAVTQDLATVERAAAETDPQLGAELGWPSATPPAIPTAPAPAAPPPAAA